MSESEYFVKARTDSEMFMMLRAYLVRYHPELNSQLPYRAPDSSKLLSSVFGVDIPYKSPIGSGIDTIMAKISGKSSSEFQEWCRAEEFTYFIAENIFTNWAKQQRSQPY